MHRRPRVDTPRIGAGPSPYHGTPWHVHPGRWIVRHTGAMPISFPFRVNPVNREVETVQSGSDAEISEAVALHVMTKPGERHLRREFGTESLPFGDGLSQGSLQLQLRENGWEHVSVADVQTSDPENGRVESMVTWERNR